MDPVIVIPAAIVIFAVTVGCLWISFLPYWYGDHNPWNRKDTE